MWRDSLCSAMRRAPFSILRNVFPANQLRGDRGPVHPKSVETAEEREKLMFRVKLQADPAVLDKYHRVVKTGVRGLVSCAPIPRSPGLTSLQVKLPQ